MRIRRFIAGLLICLVASPAWAGTGTITVLDSGGTTRTFDVITDASSHFVSMMGVCDGSAAAQCAAVKAASTAPTASDPALVVAISPNGFGLAQASTTSGQSGSLVMGAATTSAPSYTTAQTDPLSLNLSGGLRVDPSGVTSPVSGTVTANAGTGTFAVSGTVTANAGTNLNTSALALDTSVNGLLLGQASTTSGQKGPLAQGAVTTSSPSYTTAETSPLSLTTAGALRTDATATTQPVSGTVTANAGTGTFTVSGTVTANQGTANATPWNENVAQFGGNAVATGTGAGGSGIPRVTISNDSSLAANQSVNVAQFGGSAAVTGTGASGSGIPRVTISNDSSLAANQSVNEAEIGGSAYALGSTTSSASAPVVVASDQGIVPGLASPGCAGQTIANTKVKPISLTTGTAIIAGVSAKKIYICSIDLVVSAADNVALVEGTTVTTPCDTTTAGMAGGTTAATGWNLAANGGLTKGNGVGLLYITATAADNVCLLVSGSAQVSGAVTYAQF